MIRVKWDAGLVMALAVCLALAVFGWRVANPFDVSWIDGDTLTSQFGWELYRADRAHWFPIATNRYSWPLSMPLAMFDNMPLIALVVKVLAPPSLGPVQYFGPIFLIGMALQGLFAWALLREVTRGREGAAYRISLTLGALFLAASPTLLVRFQLSHIALTQHWLLLAAIWLMARSTRVGTGRTLRDFALLALVAAAINVYLMAMCMMVYAGLVLKLAMDRAIARRQLLLLPLPPITALLAMALSGFIMLGGGKLLSGEGYQVFSANLYTLFNPMPDQFGSAFLPGLPVATGGQYEGFAYLGVGAMLLTLGGLVYTRIKGDGGQGLFEPLAVVVFGAFVLALSTRITFGPYSVFLPVAERVSDLLGIFRSSGRFIWVVVYGLMFVAIAGLIRGLPPQLAAMLLGLAATVQAADLAAPFAAMHERFARITQPSRFTDPAYEGLGQAHDTLLVLPAWQCQVWEPGKFDYPWTHFIRFSWAAMDGHLATNTFYAGRTPEAQMKVHCSELPAQVLAQPTNPRTVYLLSRRSFATFGAHISASHFCHFAEDMYVCRGDRGRAGLSERASAEVAANSLQIRP